MEWKKYDLMKFGMSLKKERFYRKILDPVFIIWITHSGLQKTLTSRIFELLQFRKLLGMGASIKII